MALTGFIKAFLPLTSEGASNSLMQQHRAVASPVSLLTQGHVFPKARDQLPARSASLATPSHPP